MGGIPGPGPPAQPVQHSIDRGIPLDVRHDSARLGIRPDLHFMPGKIIPTARGCIPKGLRKPLIDSRVRDS